MQHMHATHQLRCSSAHSTRAWCYRCRQQVLSQKRCRHALSAAKCPNKSLSPQTKRQGRRQGDAFSRCMATTSQECTFLVGRYIRKRSHRHRLQCQDCQQLQPNRRSHHLGKAWQREKSCKKLGNTCSSCFLAPQQSSSRIRGKYMYISCCLTKPARANWGFAKVAPHKSARVPIPAHTARGSTAAKQCGKVLPGGL